MPARRLVPPEFFGMMRAPIFGKFARMYRAVTRQIEVTVEPNFLPERSSVDKGQYFWSYTIVITNTGAPRACARRAQRDRGRTGPALRARPRATRRRARSS